MTRNGSPIVWLLPLVAAVAASLVYLSGENRPLFLLINGWSHAAGPAPWPFITVLGDTAVALALMTPIVQRRPDFAWALAVAAVVATLFVHGLKPLFDVPRPPGVLAPSAITVIGPRHTAHSFPSGHTTTAFVGAGLICLYLERPAGRLAVIAVATIVGLSRCVVGVHWPLDVLAGAAGGWTSAVVGWMTAMRWHAIRSRTTHVLMVIVCGGCGVALLAGLNTGYSAARQLQYAIGAFAVLSVCMGCFRAIAATTFNRDHSS
ncbi:MAG: phosphatase PAP2 family protein [Betaproteobacteria bacterium]|nr:phosphatase PAP2 family protein [Betaproteobacteria bacterium]